MMPESVLIYGMGMMGASLAHAIKQSFPGTRLAGVVRSEKSREQIRALGLTQEVFLQQEIRPEVLDDHELVVLCIPILEEMELLSGLRTKALVTNISSTAQAARWYAGQNSPRFRFVASHPMCGSAESGPGALLPELYRGKLCFLIETGAGVLKQNQNDFSAIQKFWESLGMKTFALSATAHDSMLAYLSHAPHFLSSLLTRWALPALDHAAGSPLAVTGGGFRDMARIAGSNPEMWFSILESNKEEIRTALQEFRAGLDEMLANLDQGRTYWLDYLTAARAARDRLNG